MKVTELTEELVPAFRQYFEEYSGEQDESYPPPEDFKPSSEEPAYVIINDEGKLQGAASLMLYKEYREAKTGRFRIFHCTNNHKNNYRQLLDKILSHTTGLNEIYCFINVYFEETLKIWEQLGFKIKRYSYIFKRALENINPPQFPDGFKLRKMERGRDEQSWCNIINEAFDGIMGHVHMYPSKFNEWEKDPSHIPGGLLMLWHGDKPVGTIALLNDTEGEEEVIFIEAVSLLNEYQGKGLGKCLIRSGIEFGKNYGVKHVMLSVNAENEKAADLYLKEGFNNEAIVICYSYNLEN